MTDLNGFTPQMFAWLLRSTAQASVVVVLILAAQALLGNRLSARWRSALWLLLVARLLLPWSPESSLSVFNLHKAFSPKAVATAPAPVLATSEAFASPVMAKAMPVLAADPSESLVVSPPWHERMRVSRDSLLFALAAIWAIGALAFLGRVVFESIRLSGAVGRQTLVTAQFVLDMLEQCKQQMDIHPYLAVVESPAVPSPALFGFIRPRLVLPEGATQRLSREELRFVFLHELGHLKRLDIALNWIVVALQAIHWFNPLLWYAFHRMRGDREMACDALVLSRATSDDSAPYGRTILSLLQKFAPPRHLSPVAGILEDKSQLKRRITMIARAKEHSLLWSSVTLLTLVILGCSTLTSSRAERAEKDATALPRTPNTFAISSNDIRTFVGDNGGRMIAASVLNNYKEPKIVDFLFFEDNTFIGKGGLEVKPGQTASEAIPWKAAAGSHKITAVVVCPPISDPQPDMMSILAQTGNIKLMASRWVPVESASGRDMKPLAFEVVKGPSFGGDFKSDDQSLPVRFEVKSMRGSADTVKPGEVYEVTVHYTAEKGTDLRVALVCYGRSNTNTKIPSPPSGDLTIAVEPMEVQQGTESILSLNINKPDAKWTLIGKTEIKLTGVIGGTSARGVDKIDYPFVDDPELIGQWQSVDFVASPEQFKPGEQQFTGDLYLKDLSVYPGGKTSRIWIWTKGMLLHPGGDHTASQYEIKDIDGARYLFMQWKSGDYILRGAAPRYYVLKKASAEPSATPGRRVDKIDYPFVDDPQLVGAWRSIDIVDSADQFKPGEKQFKGDLDLKSLTVLADGKTKGPWRWTKGLLLHPGDKTASQYEIKDMGGTRYLFMQWKSGDYTLRGATPQYYVLKKAD